MEEERSTEIMNTIDLDLAYGSEKLKNLDNLMMRVLILGNDLEAAFEYKTSIDSTEKAMEFDLLRVILSSGVKELDNLIRKIPALLNNSHSKIDATQESEESLNFIKSKFHDAEESLKLLQERILDMKMQLTKVHMTSSAFIQNKGGSIADVGSAENLLVSGTPLKSELQSIEERQVLRMLEKSLARELDLEKILTGMKQNEDDLRLKLRLTEQVAVCMEEGAEVIWGRFLEAENEAEILTGISKEMVGRVQALLFSIDSVKNREQKLILEIQELMGKLKSKEEAMEKLRTLRLAENGEIAVLKDRVTFLEEELRESNLRLKEANGLIENNQEQLAEMENINETMKDTIFESETRADNAEAKVAQLTETNTELTDEVSFLKGNHESDTKKVSLLESQLRGFEVQLQHAKTSSEASQEQQNMLYSAIWDMETLIDELKQKVSRAENKTEHTEEQCVILSEANSELNKEVEYLRTKVEILETSLTQSTIEKLASAKDINIKANVVMDMVMQLVTERERIQQKFCAQAKANGVLMDKLTKARKNASSILLEKLNVGVLTDNSYEATTHVNAVQSPSTILQGNESHSNPTAAEIEESIISTDLVGNLVRDPEREVVVQTNQTAKRLYVYMAGFILFVSLLATLLFNENLHIFNGSD